MDIKWPLSNLEALLTSAIINDRTVPNTHNYRPPQLVRTTWIAQSHAAAVAYIAYPSAKSGNVVRIARQRVVPYLSKTNVAKTSR